MRLPTLQRLAVPKHTCQGKVEHNSVAGSINKFVLEYKRKVIPVVRERSPFIFLVVHRG
jgi:hypothetical protein